MARQDVAKLRQSAVTLVRQANAASAELSAEVRRGRDAARYVRAANRAESALFHVICDAPDDPAPRVAYGEIIALRSWAMARYRGRLTGLGAVGAARGALWAYEGALRGGVTVQTLTSLAAEPPIETEFTPAEGTIGTLHGEKRVAALADARFALAERLAAFRPGPPRDALTPRQLDATIRARDRFYRTDESLVWSCRLASCRDADAATEARILTHEAVRIYSVLGSLGDHFGSVDAEKAARRRDAIWDLLDHVAESRERA